MTTYASFPRQQHPSGEQFTAAYPFYDSFEPASPHVLIDLEAELTSGFRVEPGEAYGFFTDTSLCIGCKACEVACKEWNALPADNMELSGRSYDNTNALRPPPPAPTVASTEALALPAGARVTPMPPFQSNWLMASDVCKHCAHAGC